MPQLIDGNAVAQKIKDEAAAKTAALKERGCEPCLAVILVGDDPASRVYVNNKKKDCAQVGIKSAEYVLPDDISQEELLALIKKLNADESVHGILCQLPLPRHLDEKLVLNSISESKDVDAFHPINAGRLMLGEPVFLPCTPAGIIELLKAYNIDIAGKECVILGRSSIVGKPMALLMLRHDATVTVCHSKTKNLTEVCRRADILISAIGRARFVTEYMVKEGAVVIDVGINRDENGKICGDVDFQNVFPLVSYITPVPGGVGPMTRAILMKNTLTAALIQKKIFEIFDYRLDIKHERKEK